jgi:hypothetical protein
MKLQLKCIARVTAITCSLFSTFCYSAVEDVTAPGAMSICQTSGGLPLQGGDEDCRTTPSVFETTIYEMGLCTSHPFGTDKQGITFDNSTCTITYSDSAPNTVDLVDSIGGSLALTGISTMPPPGTYGYPYLVMGPSFTVAGSFTNSTTGDTYRSGAGRSVGINTASDVSNTDLLNNFGDDGTCYSGYLGAVVTGGTMDGFIASSALVRSEDGDVTANKCTNQARLVAVMNLTTPFTVTSKTYSIQFNFLLTDFGVQFIDTDNPLDGIPDEFGSAPFSGYFTILNAD